MRIEYALVTGAESGIGARAVQRLREAGTEVIATDVSEKLHARYASDPGVRTVVGDITDEAFVRELLAQAPRLDRVMHCAGIMPAGRVRDVGAAQARHVMRINYGGTLTLLDATLPHLRAQPTPSQLVVMGSLTGYVPMQKLAAYSASKAAVNSYVEILAEEERANGIHVLLVAPTAVRTPLLEQATGGPKFIGDLVGKASGLLMVTPDDVLDATERALARRPRLKGLIPPTPVITPGGGIALAGRRVSRRFAWWATNLFN